MFVCGVCWIVNGCVCLGDCVLMCCVLFVGACVVLLMLFVIPLVRWFCVWLCVVCVLLNRWCAVVCFFV